MKKSRQRGLACAVAIGLAGALAGCSGSPAAAPSAKPTGATVNVWAIFPANVNSDQIGAGVNAGIRHINATGGLAGHNVVVKTCKDSLTPQSEIQCAQQAADDPKSVALISPLIITAQDDVNAIMVKAGLPGINSAPDTPTSLKSKMQYPLLQQLFDTPGCSVLAGKQVGAKTVGFINTATPQAIEVSKSAADLAEKKGLTSVGDVTFPLTTTDISPFVQQIVSKKPDLIMPGMPPQLMGAFLAGVARTGYQGAVCLDDGLAPYQTLVGLGANAKKIYLMGSAPEVTWDSDLTKEFRAQAAAEVSAGDALASTQPANNPNLVLRGWLGAYALQQAAKNITGDVTRASLVAALDKTTVTFGSDNVMAPIDFSKENSNPDYPRVFNTNLILKVWNPATKTVDRVTKELVPGDQL